GVASLVGLSSADKSITSLADDSLAGVSSCSLVEADLLEMRGDMWRHISSTDPADKAQLEREIQRLKDQLNTGLTHTRKAIFSDDERELNHKILPLMEQFSRAWDGVVVLSRASRNEEA